jgi:hypothetical protein
MAKATGRMSAMVGPFDATFLIGIALVALALGVAVGAMANPDLPIVGSGRGALLAVAVLGMAGCSVGGLSQAPVLGWSHPYIVVGSVLGVVALVVIVSGLLQWDLVLRPVAQVVSGHFAAEASAVQLAIVALAGVIVVKALIGVAYSVLATTPKL